MLEPMTVRAEVWPLAADAEGLWLLSGEEGSWETGVIMADGDMHDEVCLLLYRHGISEDQVIGLHSTGATEPGAAWPSRPGPQWVSWRPSGTSIIHTYIAAIDPRSYARDTWPAALPVTVALAGAVDQPPSYNPVQAPVPREVDVLFHLLRHARFLVDTDDDNAAALGELWRKHLQPFRPVLARMYHRKRAAA